MDMHELYALSRTLLGREPDSPDNKHNYIDLLNSGQTKEQVVRTMLFDDTPTTPDQQRTFLNSLGFEYNPADVEATRLENILTTELLPKSQPTADDLAGFQRVAEQQFNPYYDELLADYLEDIGINTSRINRDTGTTVTQEQTDLQGILGLLGGRREDFLTNLEDKSNQEQRAIGGQMADAGLFQSGQRYKLLRDALARIGRERGGYEREYDYQTGQANTTAQRNITSAQTKQTDLLSDIEKEKRRYERELARKRQEAITGSVEQQREEFAGGYY